MVRLNGPLNRTTPGPPAFFLFPERLSSIAFPLPSHQLRTIAAQLKYETQDSPKKEGKDALGYEWQRNFLKRHPEIQRGKARKLSLARAMSVGEKSVDNFFQQYKQVREQHKIPPSRVWNLDECGVDTIPQNVVVLSQKGVPKNQIVSGEKGRRSTVVAMVSASGEAFTPMIIHKGKKTMPLWYQDAPDGAMLEATENGYINKACFLKFIDIWIDYLQEKGELGPKHLLLLDGHSSHTCNYPAMKALKDNDIIAMLIPPHSSHFLQPLDRAPFSQFKWHWQVALELFNRLNVGRVLAKSEFYSVFNLAWAKGMTEKNIKAGWKRSGLEPINRAAITGEMLEVHTAFCKQIPVSIFGLCSSCLLLCFTILFRSNFIHLHQILKPFALAFQARMNRRH